MSAAIPAFKLDPDKLRAKMKLHEVSAADIAHALEVERSTVSRWLAGTTQPSSDNFVGLKAALGLDSIVRILKLEGGEA